MKEPLVTVQVRKSFSPKTAWTEGKSFLVPRSLFENLFSDYSDAENRLTLPAVMPQAPEEAGKLRLRSAFTPKRPLFASLPVSYQRVPAALRSATASFWGRRVRSRESVWASFPRWPLDLSADFLSDVLGEDSSKWDKGPTPVLLSHDLDSPEGLRNFVRSFLPIEEAAGARSANYVVPCAWPIDHGLLEEARRRGCEIGIHGYDHSNRTPFCEETERRRRLAAAQDLIDRYAMTGYRAPSLFRTEALLGDLGTYYCYDSSIPTSGGPFPAPNNGCASARPFPLGGVFELPISLPRDGSLRFLGHTPDEILMLWTGLAEQIADAGGVVLLLTHCEERFSGNPVMVRIYRKFLDFISGSGRFRWSSPSELLRQKNAARPLPVK